MLPVVKPAPEVGRQVVIYSWVMVATSLLLWPVAGTSLVYPVAAAVLGAVFLVEAHRMWKRAKGSEALTDINPMRLFHASNLYLSLLFVAVALDPLLGRLAHLRRSRLANARNFEDLLETTFRVR